MNRPCYVLLALCLFLSVQVKSQELDSLFNLQAFTEESDLQKVINKDVAVSIQKLSMRETPGIISVITREEIENMGARDLVDILKMVPGFEVLQDLQFVMGLSLRGSWANEGKILVMMDGVPLNDLLYQSVAVGNRFPVDAIDRIEIIRGPGSAVYGGSAEYGVINIITKASTLNGVSVYGTTGFHKNATGRINGGLMAGQKKENYSWDLNFFKGEGIVSDGIYEDEHSLADLTTANPINLNAGMTYKGFSMRAMYDEFKTSEPYSTVSFRSGFIDLKYEMKLSSKFSITPEFQYLNQIPWQYSYLEEGVSFPIVKARATRSLGQVNAQYNPGRRVSINFGGSYFQDVGTDLLANTHMLTLNNFAFYSQALFKHRLANATVGFRFEKNNQYAGAFVPRMALTKKIENLHFKLLYSKSFRAPSLQNFLLDTTGAKPERSNVFELETGYQFTPEMLLSINAFHISTKDIIIYGYEGEEEWYENYEKSGSKGFEVVYTLKKKNWYSTLTYSFNQALEGNTVDPYRVPQTTKQYVGTSVNKISFNTSIRIAQQLNFNPTIIYGSSRYAFTEISDEGPIATKLNPYTLINIFVNYKPSRLKGLTIGGGVYDILNERPAIPQAYNGGEDTYIPIPGRSREFVAKLSYQFNFGNKL
jgi:outer membrane receptor for ferrienterochelin and colicin